MQRDYVPRMINLERSDYQIVKRMAEKRGLGDKGFSAALRMIIREWQDYNNKIIRRFLLVELRVLLLRLNPVNHSG